MNNSIFRYLLLISILVSNSLSIKILGIFPYEGRSHHIFFSSLIQELASRNHNVTVINYFSMKPMQNLKQISLDKTQESDSLNIEEWLHPKVFHSDFHTAYKSAKNFKKLANSNCEKLVKNKEVQRVVQEEKFDVVVLEQFVTDCGFGIAHQLNAPTVGITAHRPLPWTYSRLGTSNNPSYVHNHFVASGSSSNLLNRIKGAFINIFFTVYHKYIIQANNNEIVKRIYPNTPDLEELGKEMSLILTNQYFPLTGSRLTGFNVVEIGGMHIKDTTKLNDEGITNFMNNAKSGVVYISFGSKASNLPRKFKDILLRVMRKSNMRFLWKAVEVDSQEKPNNTLIRSWVPQSDLLCDPKVKVFITHSGMLSLSEAIHCGVPVVSIPLFGDQFANAKCAEESGLGVMLDVFTLDEEVVAEAIDSVLQDSFQNRAKQLSKMWKDRPMSPLDTAVYWIEYVAKYKGDLNLSPPTVDVSLYKYLMIDLLIIFGSILAIIIYIHVKIVSVVVGKFLKKTPSEKRKKRQ